LYVFVCCNSRSTQLKPYFVILFAYLRVTPKAKLEVVLFIYVFIYLALAKLSIV